MILIWIKPHSPLAFGPNKMFLVKAAISNSLSWFWILKGCRLVKSVRKLWTMPIAPPPHASKENKGGLVHTSNSRIWKKCANYHNFGQIVAFRGNSSNSQNLWNCPKFPKAFLKSTLFLEMHGIYGSFVLIRWNLVAVGSVTRVSCEWGMMVFCPGIQIISVTWLIVTLGHDHPCRPLLTQHHQSS